MTEESNRRARQEARQVQWREGVALVRAGSHIRGLAKMGASQGLHWVLGGALVGLVVTSDHVRAVVQTVRAAWGLRWAATSLPARWWSASARDLDVVGGLAIVPQGGAVEASPRGALPTAPAAWRGRDRDRFDGRAVRRLLGTGAALRLVADQARSCGA